MRKAVTCMLVTLVATTSLSQTEVVEKKYEAEFQDAVAEYYDVSRGLVQQTAETGISHQDLAVVFFIATESGASGSRIAESRLKGESWQEIATSNGVTATDFYVHFMGEPVGDRYSKTYDKFEGLKRTEFDTVELSDDDIIYLVHLKLLYHHYNYSQRLIMVWIEEGRTYVEINHLVGTITSEMKGADSAKGD